MKIKLLFFYSLLFTACFTSFIFAGGSTFSSISGTKTLSLDGLYFAGYDGVSNIISNPAALNYFRGREINLFLIDRVGEERFNNLPASDYHSFSDDNINFGGGAYWSLSEKITAGIGYIPVIDYRIDWPYVIYRQTSANTAVKAFEFANHILVNAISPSAAVNFGELSIGLSANIYWVNVHSAFPQGNAQWYQSNLGEVGYQFDYNLDGWSFGFDLGLLADLSNSLKIGANIRNGFKTNLKGDAKSTMFTDLDSAASTVDLSSKYEIPWIFGLGFIYSLNENLKINIDAAYSLWGSTQKSMIFNFNDPVWQSGTTNVDSLSGINAGSFNLSFNNSLDAGIGLEYIPEGEFAYRLSYRYSQSPNSITTYNMLFPSVDQHFFSFGIGYTGEDLSADVNVTYGIGTTKKIRDAYSSLSGDYSSHIFMPSITIRYKIL